ncbi:MAG: DUF3159 domain-containing protein [Actinomycetaceae bacterium]|nr:DUF3159 domain-containing protein [Arcanobacterium sp.]MDD7504339.1 DUF3159 domain-containing protein [Actinomycetaceae bacterium]MDY6142978.1 DUF3159 domain-containing protein [Arcanobacterium sp.]
MSTAKDKKNAQLPSGAIAAIVDSDFDALAAIGGVRGIFEAVAPTLVFLLAFIVSDRAVFSALIATGVAVLAIIIRLVQKSAVAPAVGGALAMGLSAFLAWRSGNSQDVFLWGIIVNALYCTILLVSILIRQPLIGVLIAGIQGEGLAWVRDPAKARQRSRYVMVTWLWAAMFALRLMVQLPLYYAGATQALGVAKLALGLPLFLLTAWISWLVLRNDRSGGSSDTER